VAENWPETTINSGWSCWPCGKEGKREEGSKCVNFTRLRMNEFTWLIFIPQKDAFT